MKFYALLTLAIAALLCLSIIPQDNADAQIIVYSSDCSGSYASPSCNCSGGVPTPSPPGGGYQESPGVYYAPPRTTYVAPQQQINPSINYRPQYNTTNYSILPPIEFKFGIVPGPALPTNRTAYRTAYSRPAGAMGRYPVRSRWWSGCPNWQHLAGGEHAGKFDAAWLASLSWVELQSLHSDDHEGRVQWNYVRRPQQAARYASPVRYAQPVRSYSYAAPVRYAAPMRSYGSSYCPNGLCPGR